MEEYVPVTTNREVQDDKQWRVCQRGPHCLVSKLAPSQAVEHSAVQHPSDRFLGPVRGRPIDNHRPSVEFVVWDTRRCALSKRLVAHPAGVGSAVRGAIARHDAVDLLEDVDLATLRPFRPMADAVPEEPEGRPDTLLRLLRIRPGAKGGLDAR